MKIKFLNNGQCLEIVVSKHITHQLESSQFLNRMNQIKNYRATATMKKRRENERSLNCQMSDIKFRPSRQ
jgi:hypothetical protein